MSRNSRHFEVSSVALVDLKAEISRRQLEVRERLETHPDGCKILRKNVNDSNFAGKSGLCYRITDEKKRKLDAKELARLKMDKPSLDNKEEYSEWDRSRRSLEAKAKLYEAFKTAAAFKKSNYSIDDESDVLVDFEKKAYMEHFNSRKSPSPVRSCSNSSNEDNDGYDEYPAAASDEEWTGYTDKHGIERFCMRKDLETFKNAVPRSNTDDPLTYAHLREGEVRDHGVGFYAFSKDAKIRETEMNRIRELHRATEEGRVRAQVIRNKRDAKMGQRLARLRARKGLPDVATAAAQCLGDTNIAPNTPYTPLGADSQSDVVLGKDDLDVASMLRRLRDEAEKRQASTILQSGGTVTDSVVSQTKVSEKSTLADIYEYQTGVTNPGQKHREWDKGKSMMSAQRYTQMEREKRMSEFAPPSSYY